MQRGRYTRTLFPACVILFLMYASPSWGIDTLATQPANPSPPAFTAPTQIQTVPGALQGTTSAGCLLTSVSPAAAEVGQEVVVTGQGLSVYCSVYFQNPAGGAYATGSQIIDPAHMKVIVPVMASGAGTLCVRDRNSGAINTINTTGHVVPFEVKPTVPVLQSISPAAVLPGDQVTVIGSPLKQGEPYTAYFVSSTGKRASAPINWLNATTFRVVAPDMEASAFMNEGAPYADTFYVTRGNTPSNRLALKVLPAPRCVCKSVTPTVQWTRGYVDLRGSYLTADCDVTFYSSTGQAFPAASKAARDYGLNVSIPDMPGGNGFVSTKPAGSAQAGTKIPIQIKALTPLLAQRSDLATIQGFGPLVMSVPIKNYKAYSSPATPNQPFECNAACDVYQNGGVYTYVYTFRMYEFVVTTRTLHYMSLKWPDLDDAALKCGVELQGTDISAQDANLFIKSETKFDREFDFYGLRGKNFTGYLQSKRPPMKGGNVSIADMFGQLIFISDFYVPTP